MVSFERETEMLIEQLVTGPRESDLISIFGMPGLGKTTLAKKLYNHEAIYNRFNIRLWCCSSQTYDKRALLFQLLGHISELDDSTKNMSNDELAEKLYKHLKRKRYLVVVDNVWSSEAWDDIKRPFPDDDKGSRIILTTRLESIATYAMISSSPHHLCLFTEEESWMLLKEKVFREGDCPQELEGIEDQKVPVKKLIRLWIAENFVEASTTSKSLELVAMDYFMDLISRNLVMVAKTNSLGEVKAVHIHDLIHEFSLMKAKSGNFLLRIHNQFVIIFPSSQGRSGHLNIVEPTCAVSSGQNITTLRFSSSVNSPLVDLDFTRSWKHLRVLDLSSVNLRKTLVYALQYLIHLKYLELQQLKSLKVGVSELVPALDPYGFEDFTYPSNLKKLTLVNLKLSWIKISTIGRLSNLEVLKLEQHAFKGRQWDVKDGDFPNLKVLKLMDLGFSEWTASDDSYPNLQQVLMQSCWNLKEIPESFGSKCTMQLIEVRSCPSIESSALKIKEMQIEEMGNSEFKVNIWKWKSQIFSEKVV
ncbi:putative late blight resistance protein homolog R1A-10 [Lycium barbarum]|uniref:putative late blight resistance protein homolog R1A-10 n=1 Tax=Lycium barbarum TaxID=112863 RepID=UPI00293EC6DE|nr:putative late blight resistance protein homolog R1A-10 [Lycium barbarum]